MNKTLEQRVAELEKKVAELEGQVQAQPLRYKVIDIEEDIINKINSQARKNGAININL